MSTSATGKRYTFIDLLKVILTVGIVARHASLVELAGRSGAFDVFTDVVVALTEVCVPLFFVLSGFLYFRNVPDKPDAGYFLDKTRRRVLSLLVPYLIANAVAFFFYWLAHRVAPGMLSDYFGDKWHNPLFIFWTGPVNMSLWFIRDLIVACLVAPLIYLFVRYTRIWGPALQPLVRPGRLGGRLPAGAGRGAAGALAGPGPRGRGRLVLLHLPVPLSSRDRVQEAAGPVLRPAVLLRPHGDVPGRRPAHAGRRDRLLSPAEKVFSAPDRRARRR